MLGRVKYDGTSCETIRILKQKQNEKEKKKDAADKLPIVGVAFFCYCTNAGFLSAPPLYQGIIITNSMTRIV